MFKQRYKLFVICYFKFLCHNVLKSSIENNHHVLPLNALIIKNQSGTSSLWTGSLSYKIFYNVTAILFHLKIISIMYGNF